MLKSIFFTIVISLLLVIQPAQTVLGQEINGKGHNGGRIQSQPELQSVQASSSPSASPMASVSPAVSASPRASVSPSPEASTAASPPSNNPRGQAQSDKNIILVTEPSPSVTPSPSVIEQPIEEPELLTPVIIQDPSPTPEPSPTPSLAVQLTRRITPPDFGSLFKTNPVEYYAKYGLPLDLSLALIFLSLALTLSGVLALSDSFSFKGLWQYIKNRGWIKPNESYYSIKRAIS